ncbi:GxxExxY protein [Flavivirga spongiicola]|uniref:GxxExxY protein n=1 Tax=Flavivirga spongiicola TaxID=421621 RepID=A0ABU7XWT5_9FLAO|nr:GxxExxY protein [Flavivirga sp. MEBiC05379]MDO5979905.1 GxxExxY protein [Flavivirga sp. MEBiC05379]
MSKLIYKEEAYKMIGICMEVHNQLGKGFNEVVYADALEIELMDNGISYSREMKFGITYKGNLLPHKYKADFIIDDKIVLELKAIDCLTSAHIKQTLNYLAVSKLKLGLLINFGEDSLKYKRIVL